MKRLLTAVLAIASLLMTPSLVSAEEGCCEMPSGMFASVYGGGNWSHDTIMSNGRPTFAGYTFQPSFDSGYIVGGTIGYRCCDGIRVEFDIGYRQNDIDTLTAFGGGIAEDREIAATNRISTLHYMANIVFETAVSLCDCCIRPFFGAGFGGATVDTELHAVDCCDVNDKDTVFAYQLIMGVIYPICDCVDFGVEYRFFSHEEIALVDANEYYTVNHEWIKNHSVIAHVRYTWGDLW